MRDILSDLEGGQGDEADPVQRARRQMRQPLPRRFYERVDIAEDESGFVVKLDGKAVRTPGKTVLRLPTEAAARLVADEFSAQGKEIDPSTMPVTRIANTVVDGVATDPQAVLEDIVRYSSSDLVFYRADGPQGLVELQSAAWDPVVDFARQRLGARFFLAEGVMHVTQPREAVASVGVYLNLRPDPFRLACLHVMTTLTGSALIAIAVDDGAMDVDAAWSSALVDEDWNIAQWGEDAEAAARRDFRRRDMDAALALLRAVG